jgi:hypothetical protein
MRKISFLILMFKNLVKLIELEPKFAYLYLKSNHSVEMQQQVPILINGKRIYNNNEQLWLEWTRRWLQTTHGSLLQAYNPLFWLDCLQNAKFEEHTLIHRKVRDVYTTNEIRPYLHQLYIRLGYLHKIHDDDVALFKGLLTFDLPKQANKIYQPTKDFMDHLLHFYCRKRIFQFALDVMEDMQLHNINIDISSIKKLYLCWIRSLGYNYHQNLIESHSWLKYMGKKPSCVSVEHVYPDIDRLIPLLDYLSIPIPINNSNSRQKITTHESKSTPHKEYEQQQLKVFIRFLPTVQYLELKKECIQEALISVHLEAKEFRIAEGLILKFNRLDLYELLLLKSSNYGMLTEWNKLH